MAETILTHTGIPSFGTIDELLSKFKLISQEYDIRFAVFKKIVTVMIESLENMCKYSDEYEDFVRLNKQYQPTFSIHLNSESVQLITSNPIRNSHILRLKKKIEQVNSKSRDELKQLYLKTISNGKFSVKGGAGLGFIEMAKTSGNELQYSFKTLSDDYSLYTFIVTFSL